MKNKKVFWLGEWCPATETQPVFEAANQEAAEAADYDGLGYLDGNNGCAGDNLTIEAVRKNLLTRDEVLARYDKAGLSPSLDLAGDNEPKLSI